MPSVLHRQAEVRRYRRPSGTLQQEVRRHVQLPKDRRPRGREKVISKQYLTPRLHRAPVKSLWSAASLLPRLTVPCDHATIRGSRLTTRFCASDRAALAQLDRASV